MEGEITRRTSRMAERYAETIFDLIVEHGPIHVIDLVKIIREQGGLDGVSDSLLSRVVMFACSDLTGDGRVNFMGDRKYVACN